MPPTLKYCHIKDFDRDLRRFQKRGGPSRLAADQVVEAVALWKNGHEAKMPKTKASCNNNCSKSVSWPM